MKRLHLIVGTAMFAISAITGQYMRADFPDKQAIPQELRLLMRSRHIYILFAALIHLALGIYMARSAERWRNILQVAGSLVLCASAGLLVSAFVMESYFYHQFSDISRYGIYTSGGYWVTYLRRAAAVHRVIGKHDFRSLLR
jgi:hypothetical protein